MSQGGKLVKKSVIIRADGSAELGHGHIFRTLVLANTLIERGWNVVYVSRDLPGAPLMRIENEGIRVKVLGSQISEKEDVRSTLEYSKKENAAWIVVDRYATGEHAFRTMCESGFSVLAIDDICEHSFPVNILLNQNTGAARLDYGRSPNRIELFGPVFALVRNVYVKARNKNPRKIEKVNRVLIFMGGGDSVDATGMLLRAFGEIDGKYRIDIVLGSAYIFRQCLEETAKNSPHHVQIHCDLPDLAELMVRADVAICAGGSVTWEMCCLGLPMAFLMIADNQAGIVESMQKRGAAVFLGRAQDVAHVDLVKDIKQFVEDNRKLTEIAARSWSTTDGCGAVKVALKMEEFGQQTIHRELQLRLARVTDRERLFLWANDPVVRSVSFSTDPIPWEDHVRWFDARLDDKGTLIFIAEFSSEEPVGQVRLDMRGDRTEISVSLGAEMRGCGLGSLVIMAGVKEVFDRGIVKRVYAYVKIDNESSMNVFRKSGFHRQKDEVHNGTNCAVYAIDSADTN
jgi:UDP-2,4-diacetamido-2,4,6-trideoxy-beta-L-altropyranose hydrolase